MRKLYVLAIITIAFSITGCEYVYQMVVASGQQTTVTADSTEKLTWVNEKSPTTLTVILYNNDKIYYYLGNHADNGSIGSYNGDNNITDIIYYGYSTYGSNFQLVIKQDKTGSDESLDYMLEALKIMDIKKYLLADPSKEEQHYLELKG